MVQNRLRLIQWDEVMTVLLNMLVGAMAALGLILLLWLGFAALLAPMPKSCVHIVPLRGGRTGAVIRAALRRRASGDLRGRLIFVDCGIDAEAQIEAQLLLRQQSAVLCAPEQLVPYLKNL